MKAASITDIRISIEKGVYKSVAEGSLVAGRGLAGDAFAKPGERQLSLLMGEREKEIRAAGGLCTARYNANLVTTGLDYAALQPGDRLRAGACLLEVAAVGKRCFPDDCPLRKRGETCALPVSAAFAKVLEGGALRAGDAVTRA